MIPFAPRALGTLSEIELTGMLFPWEDEQPVLLAMPMSPHKYLPCFSSEEKLCAVMERAGVSFEKIKKIDDGREFLDSIWESSADSVKVIVDPHYTETGTVRFKEVRKWSA